MKMNMVFPLLAGVLLLIGCASPDLATDPSLSQTDRQLAMRLAELTQKRCIHYKYEQGAPDRKLTGNMRFYRMPVVKRLYRSDSGWVQAEVQADSVWDNVYLLERSGAFICGNIAWQKHEDSASVSFREIGRAKLLLPAISTSSTPATTQISPRTP